MRASWDLGIERHDQMLPRRPEGADELPLASSLDRLPGRNGGLVSLSPNPPILAFSSNGALRIVLCLGRARSDFSR
jgi:hypothetical protein